MARIRTVKPEVVKHETLFDAEQDTGLPIRFAWVMLPCLCDREGRFKWKPRRMKPDLLPYDDVTDVSPVLDAFLTRGLVVKYRVRGEWYGWIPTFTKHQVINNRESASELPTPSDADEVIYEGNHELDVCATRSARVNDAQGTPGKRKGREGNKEGKENGGPRKRDEIFEAVAEVSNLSLDGLTDTERGRCNRAAKELKKVDATPDEIRRRAKIYRETWPGIDLTPNALAANWSRMQGKAEQDPTWGAE